MVRMCATGKPPLASRRAAEIGLASACGSTSAADDPPERRDAGIERGLGPASAPSGMYIIGNGSRLRAAIVRVAHDADDLTWRSAKAGPSPGPICMRSLSGSPLGQYCLAMASLMMTTPGAAPSSCSVKLRPRNERNFESSEVVARKWNKSPPSPVEGDIALWGGRRYQRACQNRPAAVGSTLRRARRRPREALSTICAVRERPERRRLSFGSGRRSSTWPW